MKIYSKRHANHSKLVIPEITRYIPSTVNVKTLTSIGVGEFPDMVNFDDFSAIFETFRQERITSAKPEDLWSSVYVGILEQLAYADAVSYMQQL